MRGGGSGVETLSDRTKATILALVLAAILFVLISPLPELDSTSPKISIAFLMLVALVLTSVTFVATIPLPSTRSTFQDASDLLAILCSRQC